MHVYTRVLAVCTNRETNKHFVFEIYFICVATYLKVHVCTFTELCAYCAFLF